MKYKATQSSPYFVSENFVDDADWELGENLTLERLWAISHSLYKNNPVVSSIVNKYIFNVVGGRVRVSSAGEKLDNVKLDINGEKNISSILRLIVSSTLVTGDSLINITKDFVQIIEGIRITTPMKKMDDPECRNGIQYKKGKVIGYWVRRLVIDGEEEEHDFIKKSTEENPIGGILFKCPVNLRPDQSRGLPATTASMNSVRYFQDYMQTIMIQARVSACFSAFITSSNPSKTRDNMEEKSAVEGVAKLSPGSVFYLNRGDSINFASPNRPSDNTDQFIRRLLRIICSSWMIPYEFVYDDLKEVSYSSWKGGKLAFAQVVETWRSELDYLVERIFSHYLRVKELKTLKKKDKKFKIKYPIVGILDEEKKARGDRVNVVNIKSKTVQDVANELGKDYEELVKERREEAKEEIRLEAIKEKERQNYRDKWGIEFPEDKDETREHEPREGEPDDPSEEDKKERRKDDGNW